MYLVDLRDTDDCLLLTSSPKAEEYRAIGESELQASLFTSDYWKPAEYQQKVVKYLGEGAYGEVHLIEVETNDGTKKMAKKCISESFPIDSALKRLSQLRLEVEALQYLQHPNVIQFHGADIRINSSESSIAITVCIYTEVCDCSLSDWLDKRPYQEARAKMRGETWLLLLLQLASAIEYIHNHRYIHRDINCSNVLVYLNSTDKTVQTLKLTDFGITERAGNWPGIEATPTRQEPATPGWRPPECRVEGYDKMPTSPLVDVWAFGLLTAVTLNTKMKEKSEPSRFRSVCDNYSSPWGYADMDESLPRQWVQNNLSLLCTDVGNASREVVLSMICACLEEDTDKRLTTEGIVWALQCALITQRYGISLHRSIPSERNSPWVPPPVAKQLKLPPIACT